MKAKDIDKIRIAGQKLRVAIRSEVGPTQVPADEDALCNAVSAIIDAVVNELSIDLRRADRPQ